MGAVPASLVLVEVLGLGALKGRLQEELVGLPPLDGAVARVQLGVHPAAEGAPLLLPLDVVRALVLGEAPLLAHHHLLQPVSPCAGKHLVDAQDVEGVHTAADVEVTRAR